MNFKMKCKKPSAKHFQTLRYWYARLSKAHQPLPLLNCAFLVTTSSNCNDLANKLEAFLRKFQMSQYRSQPLPVVNLNYGFRLMRMMHFKQALLLHKLQIVFPQNYRARKGAPLSKARNRLMWSFDWMRNLAETSVRLSRCLSPINLSVTLAYRPQPG